MSGLLVINPSNIPWQQIMPNTVRKITAGMAKAADIIIVMPGAREDPDCVLEIQEARRDGKPVYEYDELRITC